MTEDAGDENEVEPAHRRRHRRAVRPGVEQPAEEVRAWEDDDRAWGDPPQDADRLKRDVPPHWG